jgi:hypothetical protein
MSIWDNILMETGYLAIDTIGIIQDWIMDAMNGSTKAALITLARKPRGKAAPRGMARVD